MCLLCLQTEVTYLRSQVVLLTRAIFCFSVANINIASDKAKSTIIIITNIQMNATDRITFLGGNNNTNNKIIVIMNTDGDLQCADYSEKQCASR